MVAAIASVTGLAWWDEQREDQAALQDLASEQAVAAQSLAGNLLAHLELLAHLSSPRDGTTLVSGAGTGRVLTADGPSPAGPGRFRVRGRLADGRVVDLDTTAADLLRGGSPVGPGRELTILLAPPSSASIFAADGRVLSSPPAQAGLEQGASSITLSRAEAADLGLMARTAVAGLARVDAGPLGRWGVVVVATAAHERDRERRARWRLVLGVLVACGLVVAFGGVALRNQRKELRLERELAVSQAQREGDQRLLEAQRIATMGTFAMGIVHEVSTPLGVIVGRTEQILARPKDDERLCRSAQTILEQADRIQGIIRRFLDLARGGPPSFGRADPAELVRSAARAVEHRFVQANVTLSTDLPEPMPAIQCDRALLEHAIVNLLLNAGEACSPGGHVEVAARQDAQRVAFVVTDDGVGISADHAVRVTEPFFTTKPAGQGSGLGLALATEIAKSHRGELTLSPNAPRGTRACIEIPIPSEEGIHVRAQ